MIERRGPGGAPVRRVLIDSSLVSRLPARSAASAYVEEDSSGRRLLDSVADSLSLARPGVVPVLTVVTRREHVFAGLPRMFRSVLPDHVPLRQSFCKHVVASGTELIVPDTEHTPSCHREAVSLTGMRAYLGTPLRDQAGRAFGAACLIAFTPVAWSVADVALAQALARTAEDVLSVLGAAAPAVTVDRARRRPRTVPSTLTSAPSASAELLA